MHINWRSTGNDPKKEKSAEPKPEPQKQEITVKVTTARPSAHIAVEPSHVSMRLAAVTGIGLVLAAFATFYFGIDFLRASLTGGGSYEVLITAQGTFSPTTISIPAGENISLKNEHADPQVIKNKESEASFERPAIFTGEEAILPIPANTEPGIYTFYSETLSNDVTLIVNVIAAGGAQTPENPATIEDAIGEILIPSLSEVAATRSSSSHSSSVSSHSSQANSEPYMSTSVSSSSSLSTQSIPLQPAANGSVPTFGLGQQNQTDPFENSAPVPVNPYTVGNLGARPLPTSTNQQLHSGAPLTTHRPSSQPSTGQGMWLFALLATFTVGLVIRLTAAKQ